MLPYLYNSERGHSSRFHYLLTSGLRDRRGGFLHGRGSIGPDSHLLGRFWSYCSSIRRRSKSRFGAGMAVLSSW
jgi:hypothetical protein